MNRSRLASLIVAALTAALMLGIVAAPALARWRIHNGNDASEMTAPPGGTEDQTCPDRLRGAAGWSTFVDTDPPVFEPLPPEAFTSVNYEVWKAPTGFTDFGEAQEVLDGNGDVIGYNFFDPVTFDPVPATFVKFFTTAQRTELPEPIAVNGGSPGGDVYVFTSAPIAEPLPAVVVGDVLGLKPTGGSTFINLAAVACDFGSNYNFGGFVAPVDDPPTVNVGEAGSSYKVRFQLRDALGGIVDSLSAVSDIKHKRVSCDTFLGRPNDALEHSTTGESRLTFSASGNLYVYRWKTPALAGCFKLVFTFDTGQRQKALFDLT